MAADKPPYPAFNLAAIRTARAELYAATAARRLGYLQTGKWAPPRPRDLSPVQSARADLNAARAAARAAAAPKAQTLPANAPDADL